MTTPRLASFAVEHFAAELFAFPFASEAALESGLTALDPGLGRGTETLWRAAETTLLREFPSVSVDELNNLRDFLWFVGATTGPEPLATLLRHASRRWLDRRAGYAVPSLARPDGTIARDRQVEARWFWRWLTFALPPDLVLAAAGVPQREAALVSDGVARCLGDHGYGQLHLHLGAAIRFPDYWVAALHAVAVASPEGFRSPGAVLGEGRWLGQWLLRCAVGRHLIGAFLQRRPAPWRSFASFVTETARSWWPAAFPEIVAALDELVTFRLNQDYAALQSQYRAVTGVTVAAAPRRAGEIQERDPLVLGGFSRPPGANGMTPEMRLVEAALEYLDGEGRKDDYFAKVFWQVVRLRSLLYRHVVQRPLTPGLQWFVRFYDRIRQARPRSWAGDLQIDAALEVDGVGRGLRSLEFRTAPDDAGTIRRLVQASERVRNAHLAGNAHAGAEAPGDGPGNRREEARRRAEPIRYWRGAGEPPPLEVGMVLHFPKSRGANAKSGLFPAHWTFSNADPRVLEERSVNSEGYRYQRYYLEQQRGAHAIGRVLLDFPLSLSVLRGVDVCTDEQGVPAWVLAPLVRYVREAGCIASRAVRASCGIDVRGLRTTVHVGEDFVHLLGGLRRVDEAIRYFDLSEDDRLGHAMALGVEPEEWARRTDRIALPLEERWLDLVWEWSCYADRYEGPVTEQRSDFVSAEVERLSGRLFGEGMPLTPLQAAEVVKRLHDESTLEWAGFPVGRPPRDVAGSHATAARVPRAVVEFLTSGDVFERGHELVIVDAAQEGKSLRSLQDFLRRKVGRIGLAVEVNPSSNLLIGDLSDLKRHPIWRLDPPKAGVDVPPISVCIGSDDPLTFATTLREEYQLLADSLVLAGLSEDEARQWVERVRECGLRSRFTLPIVDRVDVLGVLGPPLESPRMMP